MTGFQKLNLYFCLYFSLLFDGFASATEDCIIESAPGWTTVPGESEQTVPVSVTGSSSDADCPIWFCADGDLGTFWHSRSVGQRAAFPHWIQFDLKKAYPIAGFVYRPRHDCNNGYFGKFEAAVADSPSALGEPAFRGDLSVTGARPSLPIQIRFPRPISGRYVRITIQSEANRRPFAAAAELELLSEGVRFYSDQGPAQAFEPSLVRLVDSKTCPESLLSTADPELIQQFNSLADSISGRSYNRRVADQAYDPQAALWPSDHDPVEVAFRRTEAAAQSLLELKPDVVKPQLAQLESLREAIQNVPLTNTAERFALFEKVCQIRRAILLSNPNLDFDKILFVKKHRAAFNQICDQYYGKNLISGGGIFVLENPFDINNKPTVRNLLANSVVESGRLKGSRLDSGAFATLALDYAAEKIAFGYVEGTGAPDYLRHLELSRGHWNQGRCLHVFTANADGSDLRQLTDGTWNDFYPCFLPNERIAFVSERRGGYFRCGRECPNYTIFDMNPDGSSMRCLSYHETNEWAPVVSNDGKILWTRWDYIDRHGTTAHHPWVMSLNGSDPRQLHGNFTLRRQRADTEMDLRPIPNSQKLVATAAPHHGQNYGSLVVIDSRNADREETDSMACVRRLTPETGFPESQAGAQRWGFPYPISEDLFLAVADFSVPVEAGLQWNPAFKGNYGIYLLDRFGNQELLYRDPEIGCASPIPLQARKRPVVVPELVEPGDIPPQNYIDLPPFELDKRPQATVTLANVYQSLKPLPENRPIRSLRVVQIYPMSVPSGDPPHEVGFRERSSWDSVNLVRGVLGTVPVETDGSAHFTVPAQVEIFFQALDSQGNAVQSMRSGTYFQPGDNVGCVGCHEPKGQITRPVTSLPKAFKRPPSKLQPEAEGSRPVNFPELVQPVWTSIARRATRRKARAAKRFPSTASRTSTDTINRTII